MIVFRNGAQPTMQPAFGPFGFVMPNYGMFTDTTIYAIIGAFTDRRPVMRFTDTRAEVPFTDRRPKVVFTLPEAD